MLHGATWHNGMSCSAVHFQLNYTVYHTKLNNAVFDSLKQAVLPFFNHFIQLNTDQEQDLKLMFVCCDVLRLQHLVASYL